MSMVDYLRQFFKPLDLEGNGYIKNNDFRDALMSLPQPPSDDVAEQLIKSMDKEDTGQVNYEEFVQYYVSEMDEEEKQMAMQQGGEYSDYTTSGNNADNYALDGYDTKHVHIAKTPQQVLLVIVRLRMGILMSRSPYANGVTEALDKSGRTPLFQQLQTIILVVSRCYSMVFVQRL